jgi:hypothetical protein
MNSGDKVVIRLGPFAGMSGTLVGSSRQRAQVAIVDDSYGNMEIEMDHNWVVSVLPPANQQPG